MNLYTSEAVDFFVLVLTSGVIALTVLAIASAFAFTLAYGFFREPGAAPKVRTVVGSEAQPQGAFATPLMPARQPAAAMAG
jgi:hypothetical protein